MKARAILEFEAKNKAWSHAYLFVGGSAEEKSEILNFISDKNQCQQEDLIEISPDEAIGKKGEIKVDALREMIHTINLSTQSSRTVVINSVEKLNQSSGNILLRNLEEPRSKVIFILFADYDSVLPTIKSRCRLYYLNKTGNARTGSPYLDKIKKGFPEASSEIERVVKNNEINPYLAQLESFFLAKMEKKMDRGSSRALTEIIRTKKEIAGNANPRLALEALYLKTREGLK